MEAHSFLQKKGFNIRSYGTGEKIKIPGVCIESTEMEIRIILVYTNLPQFFKLLMYVPVGTYSRTYVGTYSIMI